MTKTHCEMEMNEQVGNLEFTRDGIEVTIVGAPYFECQKCGHIELRSDVEALLKKLLEQKEQLKDSPPALYVNVPEVLGQ